MSIRALLNIKKNEKKIISPFISATELDNFINGDKICDWLSIVLPKKIDPHPLQILFTKGIHYESEVIDAIRKRLKLPLEKMSSLTTSREYDDYHHKVDFMTTINLMRKGEKIIYSAYIVCEKEKIRGIPDLLVRNDYIEEFFGITVPQGHSIFGNYYYVPMEIKFSTLHFDRTDKTLLNINRTKIYKGQLCTYAKILSEIQGTFPSTVFIIGKNMKIGHVIYKGRDNDIIKLFYDGIEWLRRVKKNAHIWDFSTELLPNMKVSHPIYDKEKKLISDYFGDITEFWQCTVKHRDKLLIDTKNEIYSWKDPNFNVNYLGLNDHVFNRVEKLIKINRGELGDIYPLKIQNNLYEWKTLTNECFVDFETVGDLEDNNFVIFLIGILYHGKYYSFVADSLSLVDEKRILYSFNNFWNEIGCPKLWYWYAEDGFWNKAVKKTNLRVAKPLNWVDLYKIFYDEPFFVKGCKNFKLKSYVKSLLKLGKINIKLPPENCCNGMDALFMGMEYYENPLESKHLLDTIITYNKFDCESLYALLDFLRKL